MAIAAPSLEDTQPEQGTILELHSIGEEFDGTYVKFHRLDPESGKYFVFRLGTSNDDKGMRVKPKCCKRLDVKPIGLRKVLNNLANAFAAEWVETRSKEECIEKLKSLLERDICCVPAYRHLAMVTLNASDETIENIMLALTVPDRDLAFVNSLGISEEMLQQSIEFYRLAGANFHAYTEVLKDESRREIRRYLSALLLQYRGENSSTRLLSTVYDESEQDAVHNFTVQYMLGKNLLWNFKKHSERQWKERETKEALQAARHFFHAFSIGANDPIIANPKARKPIIDAMIHYSKEMIMIVTRNVVRGYNAWKAHDGGQSEDVVPSRGRYTVCQYILLLFQNLLASCTDTKGSIHFLKESEVTHAKQQIEYYNKETMKMNEVLQLVGIPVITLGGADRSSEPKPWHL